MSTNNNQLENRLWGAADELRANSKLKASEYSIPVLGLIFLRYADVKFAEAEKQIGEQGSGRRRSAGGKEWYHAMGVLYLPHAARFGNLLNLPEGENIGQAINAAMRAIEAENPDLKDVLPKTYNRLENATLVELLKLMGSIPMDIEGDAFGKIYEYFLGKFAMTEGQKGGEFYTPTSIVKLIVEIIAPFHGRIFDPACGSGGMFVQSARFVQEHKKNAAFEISVYGQERVAETVRLGKMNLAVHGLAGDIRQGNTYYEDLHNSPGKFDFVMANPPFNVDRVDKNRLKDDPRFPFGLPRSDNANYLWIQIFYSALNQKGRAGFVMHNSAADSELDIRKRLINDNAVDVVILTSANLFYTVNLPCTLWFLDRGRSDTARKNKILFIDAREMYVPVGTVHREISEGQIAKLAGIVRSFGSEVGYDDYKDVEGISKAVDVSEVKQNNYSLNPKVYVNKKPKSKGEILLATEINSDIEGLRQEYSALKHSLSQELSWEVPFDRVMLLDALNILFKRFAVFQNENVVGSADRGNGEARTQSRLKFREITERYIGGGWGKEAPDSDHTEKVRVIRGTDLAKVNMGELDSCPIRYVKKSQLRSRRLQEGDIVIEVSGGGKEQSTGRSAYITELLVEGAEVPLICASFCKLLRPDTSAVEPSIAYLHLQWLYDENLIEKYEVQSTGIKNFKFENFLNTEEIELGGEKERIRFHEVAQKIFTIIHIIGAMREKAKKLTHSLPDDSASLGGLSALNIV